MGNLSRKILYPIIALSFIFIIIQYRNHKEKVHRQHIENAYRTALVIMRERLKEKSYDYRVMRVLYVKDIWDKDTNRDSVCIYLNVRKKPEADRMEATAKTIWLETNQQFDEFQVFMIYGNMTMNNGPYATATFTKKGLKSFEINENAAIDA